MTEQLLQAELDRVRQSVSPGDLRLIDPLRFLAAWYCENRQPSRARPLVQEIWLIYRRTGGETGSLTIEAMSWLATILVASGTADRAEDLLAEMVTKLRCEQNLPLAQRVSVWNQLVEVYYQRCKHNEALAICEEALQILGEDSSRQAITDDLLCQLQLNRARNNLGALHVARNEYRQAQQAFLRNLRDARRRLPPGDLSLVSQISNLAVVTRLRGQVRKAERLTIQAIRQCQQVTGWYHPLMAQGLSNLASYRLKGGRPGSAVSLFRKALKIRRQLHPTSHPQILRSKRQLADACLALGKHAAAEQLLERIRLRLENQSPQDELQLAQTLCSLGSVYLQVGRLANSERMFDRALQIQQRLLGPANSQLIPTLNGLGQLHAARANLDAADEYHRRALGLAEQHLGPNHPELARPLIWLNEIALARGDVDQAQIFADSALMLCESRLGLEHPLVAEALIPCGKVALAQGQPARALSLGARAKAIYLKSPEIPPLGLADILAIAAEASRRLHRCRGAETLSLEELRLREHAVGLEHASLLPAIETLAWSYMDRNMFSEADPVLRRGLAIAEKNLGADHESAMRFAEQIGRLNLGRQNFDEANHWLERAIKLCQRQYGEDAEEVAETLLKFANCWRTARRDLDAEAYERRAIELRNRNCHVLL